MAPSYGDKLLSIEHLSLAIGGKPILRDVNADVRHPEGHTGGQVVGFLGPSGIGKTQMFRLIAGLEPPVGSKVDGAILVNHPPTPVHAGLVGVVAQDYPLFEHRSVLGNLLLGASKKYASRAEAHDNAMELLARFGLDDKAKLYPAQLSGGQRQRVAIIQQKLCSDHFLIMDEPFSGLDMVTEEKVCQLITEIAALDNLNTILVCTHDISAAISVADHIWLIGRDRDAAGNLIPGARIQQVYDLVECDLCWHPEIQTTERFTSFVREVKERFRSL